MLARTIDDLTPGWFSDVLGSTVTDVACTTFGEGVGMLSVMARVALSYASGSTGPASVVVKLPPWRIANHDMGSQWGYFEREARFYRELLPASPNLPVPRCFHVGFDADERVALLVLADHTDSIPIDQIEGASPETAELVVDTMAAMHAAWWDRPELAAFGFIPPLDEHVEERSAARIRETFPQFAAKWRDAVPVPAFRAAERYSEQIANLYHQWAANGPHTLMHNDLRLDNMLLTERDGTREVLFVDWQRPIRFHGACDLAYFLAGSLTIDDRRQHETVLQERYLEGLREGGVTDYGAQRLQTDYRAGMLRWLGLVTTVGMLDFANERGERLARTMIERHFTAAADHQVDALLPERGN